jgi:hypothetical protein
MIRKVRKTYDEKFDQLIEKLLSPWDAGPSGGDEFVVNADIAEEAAMKLISMFERLEYFEAQEYNRQMNF